jgi:hypothetical protein
MELSRLVQLAGELATITGAMQIVETSELTDIGGDVDTANRLAALHHPAPIFGDFRFERDLAATLIGDAIRILRSLGVPDTLDLNEAEFRTLPEPGTRPSS